MERMRRGRDCRNHKIQISMASLPWCITGANRACADHTSSHATLVSGVDGRGANGAGAW